VEDFEEGEMKEPVDDGLSKIPEVTEWTWTWLMRRQKSQYMEATA